MKCEYCNKELTDGSTICDRCGAEVEIKTETLVHEQPSKPEQGMLWFKWLIYFLMFENAVFYVANGIFSVADVKNEYIIDFFDFPVFGEKFRFVSVLFLIFSVFFAVLTILVRNRLAKFKSGSPKQFIILDIVVAVFTLVFEIVSLIIASGVDATQILVSVIAAAIGELIYIMCNVTYFKKRAHLFNN